MAETYNITVVGIGAMGGGMGRCLLDAPVSRCVTGYDHAQALVDAFHEDAAACGKAPPQKPGSLNQAISSDTNFCLLVLQNEPQCEVVCFGQGDNNLLSLLPAGSCIILSSTVTATWARRAQEKFAAAGILFVDSPVSGGPARARTGELTLMCSGNEASLQLARPILDAMAQELHIIAGGAGMGSTVKMVHQLLAGVHIVASAEALALAAKAGLDVQQMYEIVNGAAGSSWMFRDRGPRMLSSSGAEVKSQLQIFVKDLDIVHAEAKRLQCPVPVASAALQQYISGQSLGLSKQDDSQVVQVYETLSGVKVRGSSSSQQQHESGDTTTNGNSNKEGDNVGDYWRLPDGTLEQILEVGEEPYHKIVISNEYIRALRVSFPPGNTTHAHRHAEDSLYFFLAPDLEVVNHVQGIDPACDCMNFGEVRYGTHKTERPLVHKITNTLTDRNMLCVDAEILKQPPVTSAIPLVAEKHELIKTRDKCRVYKLTLEPGEAVTVCYPFFYLSVVVEPGTVEKQVGGRIRWIETPELGDVAWKEPTMEITKRNAGQSTYIEYIAEWC